MLITQDKEELFMFHENLKTLRKEKGLSQEELASRLHVVRQTISKWEKATSIPDADLLIKIAEELDTSVGVLLGENLSQSTNENDIALKLENLNTLLAQRNQSNRRIWKIVKYILVGFFIVFILAIIMNWISFQNYSTNTSSTIEVVEE